MSVLVFVELNDGKIKKSACEAVSYGAQTAQLLNSTCEVILLEPISENEAMELAKYGATKITLINDGRLKNFDAAAAAKVISDFATTSGSKVIVASMSSCGKAVAPLIAAKLQAGIVSGAIAFPQLIDGKFMVKKNVFSGKAYAHCEIKSENKVISIVPNAFAPVENQKAATVQIIESGLSDSDFRIKIDKIDIASGEIALTDADIVVSGGRGMKGPEHWGMLEDMAKILGAATACSRPVADTHWRPHHEHVGQTGFTVRPNLYIAIGISGAIQHLAGVNGSKVIVVINKDPEAPFFKAADYGIVGDAFEVVPKLNEAFRKFKQTN